MDPITYEIRLHIHAALDMADASWNFLSRINSLAANLVVCRVSYSWQKMEK